MPLAQVLRQVHLESSALTNTIFLHRVQPSSTDVYDAAAAFLRYAPVRLERVEQTYQRTNGASAPGEVMLAYTSPAFDTYIDLRFDRDGLVIDYARLATRHS